MSLKLRWQVDRSLDLKISGKECDVYFFCDKTSRKRHMKNEDLLLVIDMQNVYKEGEAWGCKNVSKASENIRKLLDSGVFEKVIFTEFKAPDVPEGSWHTYNEVNELINKDERLNAVMEEFEPYLKKYPIYEKSTYSSFSIPKLCKAATSAAHVVLTGVVAECCVLATALAGIDLGFPIIYISDGVAGFTDETEKEAANIVSYLTPVQSEVMTANEYIHLKKSARLGGEA